MFRTGRALALCVALLGLHGVGMAQVSKSAAEGLMRKSGLWEQLGSIAPQMETGLPSMAEQAESKLSPAELKQLGQAFAVAYSPMHLRTAAQGVLSAGLSPADLPKLAAWYDSEDGQAVTRAEEAAAARSGETQARLQEGVQSLGKVSAERQALLTRLIEVSQMVEFAVDITINSAVGMHEGLAKAQPKGSAKFSAKALRDLLEKQRPQMTKGFGSMVLALCAGTYEGVDDARLGRYVDFLSSPQGSAYTELSLSAVNKAFVQAGHALGRSMPAVKSNANL